jgi:hypothetical protein
MAYISNKHAFWWVWHFSLLNEKTTALKICILQRIKNDHREKDEMDDGIGVPYILKRKEMTNNEKRTILTKSIL